MEFYVSHEPINDYRAAQRTDLHLKGVLARGMRGQGIFGGGGRYNCSLAHGDNELAQMLKAVDSILAN